MFKHSFATIAVVFVLLVPTADASVTDGTSNTIMFGARASNIDLAGPFTPNNWAR